MDITDYIKQVGVDEFAKRFGVTRRAAYAWKLKDRRPRRETAQEIVEKTPVTWDGIYGKTNASA
jgi:hypothetical protein